MSSWFEFLQGRGARIADGRVADFGNPARELAAARDATIVADLSDNALIAVSGDDATTFLHNQLTNDVQGLAVDAAQWTGWCSPKGRLLASFVLVRRADRYLLLLPAEIAPAIQKRLSMFVLRSKVKLEDVSASYARIGIAGKEAGAAVTRRFGEVPAALRAIEGKDGSIAIALEPSRFVIAAPVETAHAIWETFAAAATSAGTGAWDWTAIRAGIPTILTATQEAFVPQMANFDLIGAVSFRKGCYPGQEIVARTQYRGILKKRMVLAHLAGDGVPAPGESVYSEAFGDQAAGTIANSAPSPEGGYDALVVAQLEGIDRDDLRWKSPQGPSFKILSRPRDDAAS